MAETFFRGQIDNILIVASWVERLQREVGITNVSQVWSEHPGWYLWLQGAVGVYGLELVEAAPLDGPDSPLIRGRFAIKLYPRPGQPVFETFSPQERALVQGPLFDHHPTPTFEGQEAIAPHLFQVGLMEMIADPEDDWALFSLSALDAGLARDSDQDGALVRRVPGWDLSHQLFRLLLSLYAFSSKNRPARISLVHEPGFCQVLESDQVQAVESNPDSKLRSLSALFCADPAQPPPAARRLMEQAASEDALFTAFDLSFACGHLHTHELGDLARQAISQDWWRYAGVDYKSELASSCGCKH